MNEHMLHIGKKTFMTSVLILLALMMVAGVLTKIIPSGSYDRILSEGRESVVADSYVGIDKPDYPMWRWFSAPFEVLGSSDAGLVIVIIVFLVVVGGAISVLNQSGVLNVVIDKAIHRFEKNKYILLWIMVFVFMSFGAFVGIFEEVVPLVPIVIALSFRLGWDKLTGLGMSLLAAGYGFAAAVSNPFTIGVAQKIAELPIFSGAGYRLVIFFVYYVVLCIFLTLHVKKIEAQPSFNKDQGFDRQDSVQDKSTHSSVIAFVLTMLALVGLLIATLFSTTLSEYAMPIIGLIFLVGGLSAGFLSRLTTKEVLRVFRDGLIGVAPAILLILMAASIKQIISSGQIMDTILFYVADAMKDSNSYIAIFSFFILVLGLEFMIGSGSAKAFLVMPIVIPLADLLDINRQVMVLAFQFGDGFSNVIYPTNPVILISLGICAVSYTKWFKFTIKLQGLTLLLNLLFLAVAVVFNYGPF